MYILYIYPLDISMHEDNHLHFALHIDKTHLCWGCFPSRHRIKTASGVTGNKGKLEGSASSGLVKASNTCSGSQIEYDS